jgi:pre-mRNA-splicing helicase BRR2
MRSPNPLEYGITIAERRSDPDLLAWRTKIIKHAAKKLFESRMIVYVEATGQIRSTSLGRVASHFYVDHGTCSV